MLPYFLFAVGIVMLILFLIARDKKSSMLAIILKTVTSLFFIATGVAALVENGVANDLSKIILPGCLVILGLVLGMVGDITLDFKIYFKGLEGKYEGAEKDRDAMMYFGMLAFGIGHILYITSLAIRFPGYGMNVLWSALVSLAVVAIMFVVCIFALKMQFGKFLVPGIIYAFLLCWFVVMSAMYVKPASGSTSSIVLLVGSILFVVSDMVLSMTYFSKPEDYQKQGVLNPESRLMIIVNHVTYYLAQFLIALSLLFI